MKFNILAKNNTLVSILFIAAVCLFLGFIFANTLQIQTRSVFIYNAETDVIGRFIPEAKRFLSGHPMNIEFHPPFYPIVLGMMHLVTDDWLQAGLIISLISAIGTVIFVYILFGESISPTAGILAALGLLASPAFWRRSGEVNNFFCFYCMQP